jgi:hypothetical protein
MNSFQLRQKGYEHQFVRDQEITFRITARRNKLLGLWAADRLGLAAGEAADAYARTVVAADFEAPGDDDVVKKVHGDLNAKAIDVSEAEVWAELARAAAEARRQFTAQ